MLDVLTMVEVLLEQIRVEGVAISTASNTISILDVSTFRTESRTGAWCEVKFGVSSSSIVLEELS
jgi:hypothetical protein